MTLKSNVFVLLKEQNQIQLPKAPQLRRDLSQYRFSFKGE